jgi:hypothetical protein
MSAPPLHATGASRRDRRMLVASRGVLCAAILLPWLLGCAAEAVAPADAAPTAGREDLVTCGDVRPEMCTREYRPVCALRDTGVRCVAAPCDEATEWVTRPNACDACADPAVIGHRPGDCAAVEAPPRAPLDI